MNVTISSTLYRYLWNSGTNLIIVTFFASLLSFFPLFAHFRDDGRTDHNSFNLEKLSGFKSKGWENSLMITVSLSAPFVISVIMEVVYNLLTRHFEDLQQEFVPRVFVLFSLFVPNILDLLISVPFEYAELSSCLFASRLEFFACGVLGHMWVVGGEKFRTTRYFTAYCLMAAGFVLCSWDNAVKDDSCVLFWAGWGILIVSGGILLVCIRNYLNDMKDLEFRKWTTSQMSCTAHLSCASLLVFFIFVSGIVYIGRDNYSYIIIYSSIQTSCAILLMCFQCQVTKHGMHIRLVS